jgi:hypothetical protein
MNGRTTGNSNKAVAAPADWTAQQLVPQGGRKVE